MSRRNKKAAGKGESQRNKAIDIALGKGGKSIVNFSYFLKLLPIENLYVGRLHTTFWHTLLMHMPCFNSMKYTFHWLRELSSPTCLAIIEISILLLRWQKQKSFARAQLVNQAKEKIQKFNCYVYWTIEIPCEGNLENRNMYSCCSA